jgi:ribonuclease-3
MNKEQFLKENDIAINNRTLLEIAFTHPTYVFENKAQKLQSNQRLEFLGDAVLGLIVAQYLYDTYPDEPEGVLTKMRAAVVCESMLADIAKQLGLGSQLKLGKGEDLTGGRERSSTLADAFEALLGAIYLDGGLAKAKEFLSKHLLSSISKPELDFGDYKTHIQELYQRLYGETVWYKVLSETGPDHKKSFESGIYLKDKLLAIGNGNSKKEAEQDAAKKALENSGEFA